MANRLGPRLLTKLVERRVIVRCSSGATAGGDSESNKVMPLDKNVDPKQLTFDQPTHTGQAWDQEDLRNMRWVEMDKLVNPNIAMHLVAEVPPTPCKERVVFCDGGGGALGHPKIYINLDKPGNHGCGYCGLRFYKEGLQDGPEQIQV